MFINEDFYIEVLVPIYRTSNLVLFVNKTCYKMRRVSAHDKGLNHNSPLLCDFRVPVLV